MYNEQKMYPYNRMSITTTIFNPAADKTRAIDKINQLQNLLQDREAEYQWLESQYPGHTKQLGAEAIQSGSKKIVVVGGDGTVYEIVNTIMYILKERRPQLAIIPMDGEGLSGFDSQIYKIEIGMVQEATEMIVQTKKGAFQQ